MLHSSNSGLVKVSTFLAIVVIILLGVATVIVIQAEAPTIDNLVIKNNEPKNEDTLDTISTSSSVKADLDAYIDSSGSLPNPNDFNDSYSDLNQ